MNSRFCQRVNIFSEKVRKYPNAVSLFYVFYEKGAIL